MTEQEFEEILSSRDPSRLPRMAGAFFRLMHERVRDDDRLTLGERFVWFYLWLKCGGQPGKVRMGLGWEAHCKAFLWALFMDDDEIERMELEARRKSQIIATGPA